MRVRTIGLVAVGAAVGLLTLAAPAYAHVTVTAPGAAPGSSDAVVTFRVPTESDAASTTTVKVRLPTDTPIADVLVQPTPGWTHTQKTAKLAKPITTDDGEITEAVSEIDWTAQPGGGIKPGEFGQFVVIAGQLPDAKQITFKVIQGYSDGTQVAWIEVPAPGSTVEPEHPAPTLTLSAVAAPAAPQAGDAPAATSAKSDSQTGAVILSVIALVLALAAAAMGAVALISLRKRRAAS